MWFILWLGCGFMADETDAERAFRYENEHPETYTARVSGPDGSPVSGVVLAVRASNTRGDTQQLARGVSTADGTARIRAVVPNAWSDVQLVALHPDYEVASASVSGWAAEDGWDSTVSISLTAR